MKDKEVGIMGVEEVLTKLKAMLRKDAEVRRKCEREKQHELEEDK